MNTPEKSPLALTLPVIESNYIGQNMDCIIGMDVLCRCELYVDGPNETAVLIYKLGLLKQRVTAFAVMFLFSDSDNRVAATRRTLD